MLRRFFSPRTAFQQTVTPFRIGRRNITFRNAFKSVAESGPPVLARYPVLYTIVQSLKYGLGFVLAAHVFVDYFYAIHGTWGISMVPTLAASGDSVLISKYYRHGRDLKVGDIVSFKHPLREDIRASKRIIGMPGDFVLRDTPEKGQGMMIQVFQSMSILEAACDTDSSFLQVPQGHCWVVGDNLNHSRDSRMFGPIPLGLVKGKVVAIFRGWTLWPERVPDALVDSSFEAE